MSEQRYVLATLTLKDGLEFYGPFSRRGSDIKKELPVRCPDSFLHQMIPLEGNRNVSLHRDLFVIASGNIHDGFSVRGPFQSESSAEGSCTALVGENSEEVHSLNVPDEVRPDIYVIHCTGPRGQFRFVGPYTNKDEAGDDACQLQRILGCGTEVRECERCAAPDVHGTGERFVILAGCVDRGWDIYGPYSVFRSEAALEHVIAEGEQLETQSVELQTMDQILGGSCDE